MSIWARRKSGAAKTGAWRANLALAVASLVFVLGATEIMLRLVGIEFPRFYMLDPQLGWHPRPGVQGWSYHEGGGGFVSINHDGYRDVEHSLDKAPGTYRIALLGDSMSEGVEVNLDELYWKRMEKALSACPALGGRRVELVSLAVNGYGTAQEYLTLQQHGLKYRPDLVLLAVFTGNDFSDNSKSLGGHRDRPYYTIHEGKPTLTQFAGQAPGFARRKWWDDLQYRLFERWRVVQLAQEGGSRLSSYWRFRAPRDMAQTMQIGLESAIYAPPKTPEWEEAWQLIEALTLAIRDLAKANGAAFAMTTLATPIQDSPDPSIRAHFEQTLGVSDLTYPDRTLAAFAAANGFPAIPLVDALAAYSQAEKVALHGFDPKSPVGHWNVAGHRVAGAALADGLCARIKDGQLKP